MSRFFLIIFLCLIVLSAACNLSHKFSPNNSAKRNNFVAEANKLKVGEYKNFSIFFNSQLCDMPNFHPKMDWDAKTQTILVEAYLSNRPDIMLFKTDGTYNLIGRFGQGPDEIQGEPCCLRFLDGGQIGAVTIGYPSFIVMDREGKINFKLAPLPFLGRVCDFILKDDELILGDGGYFDYKNDLERPIIFSVNLGDRKLIRKIFTYGEFLEQFTKLSSFKPHYCYVRIFNDHAFFLGKDFFTHYLAKDTNKKQVKCFLGFFYNSFTKKINPLYLNSYFSSGSFSIIGYSKIDNCIFVNETYLPPSLVARILNNPNTLIKYKYRKLDDLLQKSEIFYKIDTNGKVVGVYRYCDEFCNLVFGKTDAMFTRCLSCLEISKDTLLAVQSVYFPQRHGIKKARVRLIVKTKLQKIDLER